MMAEEVFENRIVKIWRDEETIVHITYKPDSAMTLAGAEEVSRVVAELAGSGRVVVIVDLSKTKSADRKARNHLSGPGGQQIIRAAGLVVSTPLSRMMGNLFLGFSKPLYPVKLFSTQAEAVGWLRQFVNSSAHDEGRLE